MSGKQASNCPVTRPCSFAQHTRSAVAYRNLLSSEKTGWKRGGGVEQQQQTYYPYHFCLNIPLCFEIREEYEQTNRFYHFQALEHIVIIKSSKLTTRHNSCTSCCMKESNVSHLKPKYGSFRNKKNKCECIRNHTNKMQPVTQLIIL